MTISFRIPAAPIPTMLKSDRLGIGIKVKTEGPYRTSVKTCNSLTTPQRLRRTSKLLRTCAAPSGISARVAERVERGKGAET